MPRGSTPERLGVLDARALVHLGTRRLPLSRRVQVGPLGGADPVVHPSLSESWPPAIDIRDTGAPSSRTSPGSSIQARPNIYPAHATLLRSFGGIVDRANEPEDTWLLNNNEVLTEREASYDSSFIEHYAWAFEETPGHIPIVTGDYYSIAREANGNDTLCHRRDRTVLLFAPDHSFDHVAPLAGCPDYTPYTREGASRFTEWVEVVARQWSSALERAP